MSQPFENALIDPDDNVACRTLHGFLTKETIPAPPARLATAKAYLEAFCDQSRHVARRRWVGLLLTTLLESCLDVVHHLRRVPDDLVRVGAIILGLNEAEETKIVAGLIIRAGFSQGIKFSDFWSDTKLHGTAAIFPTDAGTSWMRAFQDYMDALSELSPESFSPDLLLFYPVACIAADGFRWSPRDENPPLLLVESQSLTMITPASALHEINFVHIPFKSIQNVRCKPSNTYDSQGAVAPASPWAVILEFMSTHVPYQVNSSEHSGSEITMTMETMEEAKECARYITDIIGPQKSSSEVTGNVGPALHSNPSKGKTTQGHTKALSQGGVIMFDRSKREESSQMGVQQTQHSPPEPTQVARTEAAQVKLGALPEVKKSLRSSGIRPELDVALAGFEFPEQSPSIRRHSKAKTKMLSIGRIGDALSHFASPKSNIRKPAASKSKLKVQETHQLYDRDDQPKVRDAKAVFNFKSSDNKDSMHTVKGPIAGITEAEKPQRHQSDVLRDVLGNQEGTHEAKGGVRGGTRRTRAVAVTYKEESSSEEECSISGAAEKQKTTSRIRPSRAAGREKSLALSPTETAKGKRRARNAKSTAKPLQPLTANSLSNTQATADAKRGTKPKSAVVGDEESGQEKAKVAKRTTRARNAPGQENFSSEANIVGKLNDLAHDDELSFVASRKRTATSTTPSTPRSKRARLDHEEIKTNESTSMKPPITVAPVRVLEDPSSPCGGRADRSMQAPPKPATEELTRLTSPIIHPSTGRSRKPLDERQTPV